MPVVTVPLSPSGEPTATTGSPTRSRSESPSVAVGQVVAVDLDHREVVGRRAADDVGRQLDAVGEGDRDRAAVDGTVTRHGCW